MRFIWIEHNHVFAVLSITPLISHLNYHHPSFEQFDYYTVSLRDKTGNLF